MKESVMYCKVFNCDKRRDSYCCKSIYDRDKEALQMAVRALEKQMPKKFVGRLSTLDINCPCCNSEDIYDIPNRRIVKQNYCPNCGQAIDWEEQT